MTIAEALALAARHYQAGQLAPAEQICRQIVQVNPAQADALHLLGLLAYRGRRWDDAIGCYRQVLALRPDDAEIHTALSAALMERGQWTEALQSVHEALRLNPNSAEANANQGSILKELGQWREAEASYRCALRLRPDFPPARNNLGAVLIALWKYAEAEVIFRDLVRLWPDSTEALYNLGMALGGLSKHDEALACYEEVLHRRPDSAEALVGIGHSKAAQGQIDEAIRCYRQAAVTKPRMPLMDSCLLFTLHFSPVYDPEAAFAEHKRWGAQFGATPAAHRPLQPIDRDVNRRLRIGYVSADFRDHVVGRYCEGVIAAHDHGQFEIFCYSTVPQEDERTARIRAACDHWRSLVFLTDAQAAERILKDRIDVLVDLTGHTSGTRLGAFARKPAPIQVSHFGYPASTGLPAMDYRLTDAYFDPPGMTEHLYCEKLMRMPEACWCYVPWASPDISLLPAQQSGAVTFACISMLSKINEDIIALWAHILKELPQSRMLLVTGAGRATDERLRSLFGRHGIAPERLTLIGRQSVGAYLPLFQEIDIVLDTYPFTGCNTTADALWMGVPVVSRVGRSCVSRLAVAPLLLAGLDDLVTDSPSAYVAAAVGLAQDLPRLRELRGQLRDRVRRTLGDVERFTRQLERVYRDLWQTYCQDSSPQPAPIRETENALALAAHHYQAGLLTEAERLCRQIVQVDPGHVHALYLLGLVAHRSRRWDEAIAHYRQALQQRPEVAEIHFDLGTALNERGQLAEAVASYKEALRYLPDYPEAQANLGDVLRTLGRHEEAEAQYRSALRLRPDFAQACNNLGGLLMILRRYAESEAVSREYLRLEPTSAIAHYNLGLALEAQAKLDEAMHCFTQVLRIQPDHVKGQLSRSRVAAAQKQAQPDVPLVQSSALFSMYYAASYDPGRVFAEHLRWGRQFGERPAERRPPRPVNRDPDRRLRTGYVSGDFRTNVVGRYCEGVIGAHDRRQVEVFCYSNVSQEDEGTERIKALSDHWQCITQLTDAQAAEAILQDKVDLLIDLSGHCAGNRLGVFARKPAPIQVTHFGYPGSTGLLAMDYRLTDTFCDPPGQTERWHTEKLVRLPQSWWCYLPWGSPEIGPLPAQRAGAVVFACACNQFKVTDDIIDLWAQILSALPASRMLVIGGLGRDRDDHVRAVFRQRGIGPEQVTLVPRQGVEEYLRFFQGVDILLDTYPFTGCNVTADALWMGVPVVTRAGPTAATRQGLSILSQVGLEDLAATTPQGYVEIAVRLAQDLPRLRELRGALRERLRRTLGDVERFTRQLEAAYRAMWQTYCQGTSEQQQPAEDAAVRGSAAEGAGLPQTAGVEPHPPETPGLAARAHNDRGGLLLEQKRFVEAEVSFHEAMRLCPQYAELHYNLGLALAGQGKSDEAIACYEEALRIDPDCVGALNNLGIAVAAQGRADEAIACYRRAVALRPEWQHLHSNLLFALLYSPSYEAEAVFGEHLRWASQFVGREGLTPRAPRLAPHDPGRRLRIGYVSAHFCDYVVGRYCEAVLTAHDHEQFEVFCYTTVAHEDERTGRIKAQADHWRSFVSLTDAQAAEQIQQDRIDLLIDLAGHSAGNRLPVFARKPAPIQVSHFGYPASTGLAAMDYRLTDRFFDPPGMTEHLYCEKLVRMPETCWCYVPWASPPIGLLPAQRPGAVTFASISTLNKVTEEMLALWAHILRELPQARMLLVTGAGRAGDKRVRSAFANHGIARERVKLVGRQQIDAYLRLFDEVDIVLDTYPYTGGNTTADALWMGVPVVSRAGRCYVSRLAVSALMLTGLEDLLTDSSSAYVEAAIRLARDQGRLRELRGQLRDRVRQTLGDVGRFTRQLEAAYRSL
jgi:predicted O-linked N-acetylglucosamine transferase (SPINDLY family)